MSETIEIPLSRKKIFLVIMGASVFVFIGILFAFFPEVIEADNSFEIYFLKVIGMASLIFFGTCLIYGVYKLFDKRFGLKIDDFGITDNSSAISAGLIEWKDIQEIEVNEIGSQKYFSLITDDPQKYINRASNFLTRKAMITNLKMYETPLQIGSTSLKISFEELEEIIFKEFEKRIKP